MSGLFRQWRWLAVAVVTAGAVAAALYPWPVCACSGPAATLATFADVTPEQAADAQGEVLARGLNQRLAAWTYTYEMLPPDLRSVCSPDAQDRVYCRLVTRAALLRELGVELTFVEDAQGFLAHADVRPFSRWRLVAATD